MDAKANLPLPAIGLRWDYHFSRRWSAGLSGGAFSLKVGKDTFNAEGTLWTGRAYGEYRFARNLGLGVALESLRLSIDASDDQWNGNLKYRYWGPLLYLKARF